MVADIQAPVEDDEPVNPLQHGLRLAGVHFLAVESHHQIDAITIGELLHKPLDFLVRVEVDLRLPVHSFLLLASHVQPQLGAGLGDFLLQRAVLVRSGRQRFQLLGLVLDDRLLLAHVFFKRLKVLLDLVHRRLETVVVLEDVPDVDHRDVVARGRSGGRRHDRIHRRLGLLGLQGNEASYQDTCHDSGGEKRNSHDQHSLLPMRSSGFGNASFREASPIARVRQRGRG